MTDTLGTSVLIVEDDAIIAHDISILLKRAGYLVKAVCHNATKAIDRLAKSDIDFAILDIHLGSGASGIDVAKIIHETYQIPYIFLTSYSDSTTLDAAREQGPYGYLVKPFQEATLLSTISIAISNHRMSQNEIDFENLNVELTTQEKSICELLYNGKPYQEIADEVHISINTVRYHVKNLYQKFDVNSRASLIASLIK